MFAPNGRIICSRFRDCLDPITENEMNKYELKLIMNDGTEKYDFTSPTSDSIEKVQSAYNAIVEKAQNGAKQFESFKNCLRVEVTI